MEYIVENVNSSSNDNKTFSTVAFGYSFQRREEDDIDDLLKEAEHFMYKRKYYENQSAQSNTVKLIMQTLFEKSKREKDHSERVGLICEAIAKKMNFTKQAVNRIKIAGFLHDREKNLIEILTTVEKIAGPLFAGESYQAAKRIIIEPKGKWKSYVEALIKEIDHTVLRTTALNLGFEAAYLGTKTVRANRQKYGFNIP